VIVDFLLLLVRMVENVLSVLMVLLPVFVVLLLNGLDLLVRMLKCAFLIPAKMEVNALYLMVLPPATALELLLVYIVKLH